MHGVFIGGPLDGEIDEDPLPLSVCEVLMVGGISVNHIYRVKKQIIRRDGKIVKKRLVYRYNGTLEGEDHAGKQ